MRTAASAASVTLTPVGYVPVSRSARIVRPARVVVLSVGLRTTPFRVPGGPPLAPAILEVPDQFLFLGIHRDHRLAPLLEGPDLAVEVRELGVAVGMGRPLFGLAVALQAVVEPVQQLRDRLVADA